MRYIIYDAVYFYNGYRKNKITNIIGGRKRAKESKRERDR